MNPNYVKWTVALVRLPTRARSLLLLLLALVVACADSGESAPVPPGSGVYIEAAWRVARTLPGHQSHVVKHQVPCVQCHTLTNDALGPPVLSRCATCHAREARIQHAAAEAHRRPGSSETADCTFCHQFSAQAAEPAASPIFQATDCARCHARAQGSIPAIAVHGSSPCVSCHRPHEDPKPKPAPCAGCHGVETAHASTGKSQTEVCTTCHTSQHAPAAAALSTCASCHARLNPPIPATALFKEGHSACVGCHRPHEFEKSKVASCRSCHAGLNVLAAASVQAHAVCTSCHSPHAVRESPLAACRSCHAGIHPEHPEFQGKGGCVGCHDPHPRGEQLTRVARPCSSCHQRAASEAAFHEAVACKDCHQPHRFALGSQGTVVCSRCHSREMGLVTALVTPSGVASTGHAACEGCHRGLPHHPKSQNVACGACHGEVEGDVTHGHHACTSCHEPHSGQRQTPCSQCHEREHASAPAGHRVCTSCHEPHTGSPTRSTCNRCHETEALSKHGKITGNCGSCHRPHGPQGTASPPACTTCHQTNQLAGLHGVPQHQTCNKCHGGHDDSPLQTRAPCLACHTDRRGHFPDAPRCVSCHLFDRSR